MKRLMYCTTSIFEPLVCKPSCLGSVKYVYGACTHWSSFLIGLFEVFRFFRKHLTPELNSLSRISCVFVQQNVMTCLDFELGRAELGSFVVWWSVMQNGLLETSLCVTSDITSSNNSIVWSEHTLYLYPRRQTFVWDQARYCPLHFFEKRLMLTKSHNNFFQGHIRTSSMFALKSRDTIVFWLLILGPGIK